VEPPPATAASDPALRQPTLLVQLRGDDQLAAATALLAVGGPSERGTMVLIPSNLYLDAPTGGNLPLSEVARLPDANASADAISDLIGVRVDGTFVMDPAAFAGLVDAVGGITASVDVNVTETDAEGTTTIVVPAGTQRLTGLQATKFATYLAPGEPEQARLARFQQVFRLVMASLPAEPTQIDPILTSLGSLGRSTVPTSQLGEFFSRFHSYVVSDEVDYPGLPVTKIETGGEDTAFGADQQAAAAMVTRYLSDAVRQPGPNSKVRVLVQNGRIVPGLGASARDRLVDGGFTYVYGGNAPTLVDGPTQIVVPDTSTESLQWGSDIAKALGVPETDVRVATEGQTIADVIVVLGTDFPPKEG
jgi:anionic cell wall polymer biosynthesis LytR-Cps2A-Psr (LCP) family protein